MCIEPIFRLLVASGVDLGTSLEPDVWYPTVPTIWDIKESVIKEYEGRGFNFEDDRIYLKELVGKA